MLKIIDDYDLKGLEKLGFEYSDLSDSYKKELEWWHIISVDCEDRIIYDTQEYCDTWETDPAIWEDIKDIIPSEIVEKVDE